MEKLLGVKELSEMFDCSPVTIYRKVGELRNGKDNGFPPPFSRKNQTLKWRQCDVDACLVPSVGNRQSVSDTPMKQEKRLRKAQSALSKNHGIDLSEN